MANTNGESLAIPCPQCFHDHSWIVVSSATVVTLKCAACAHAWAEDLESLLPAIRKEIDAAAEGRNSRETDGRGLGY
jgi:hypothetical protein